MNFSDRMRRVYQDFRDFKHSRFGLGLLIVVVVIGYSIYKWDWVNALWNWLREVENGKESNSATIRNIGFWVVSLIALWMAIWRARIADRQAETADQGLLNERYQKGAEMLGNDVLSVRLGGIYALQRLAKDHPEHYHIQIMQLFCTFARNPIEDDNLTPIKDKNHTSADTNRESGPECREDVQAVMDAIGVRDEKAIKIEKNAKFRLDLRSANLKGSILPKANLSDADLSGANLSGSFLREANLSRVFLWKVDLSDADLSGAFLAETNLLDADLSGAFLAGAILAKGDLPGANLAKADLSDADLSGAFLAGAILSGANLTRTNLSGADLSPAILSGAILSGADLSSADLSGAKFYSTNRPQGKQMPATGLTQAQLDLAQADSNNPPKLDGVVLNDGTNEPLVWRQTIDTTQTEQN